jgi:hypothetical protein
MDDIDLNLVIYSSNISSLVSIFYDSAEIREKRLQELRNRIGKTKWSDAEFQQFNHYDNHFDWLLMQSLFISGFSHFENFLRSVAIMVEKQKGELIKLSDIKGDGNLDTYRKYIYLIGHIQNANNKRKEWQTILEFKTIRNAIIHENGIISKKLSKIKEHQLYFGPSENYIRIKNIKFLEDFSTSTLNYMRSIASELRETLKSNT